MMLCGIVMKYEEKDKNHHAHDARELERVEIAEQPRWFARLLEYTNESACFHCHHPDRTTKGYGRTLRFALSLANHTLRPGLFLRHQSDRCTPAWCAKSITSATY